MRVYITYLYKENQHNINSIVQVRLTYTIQDNDNHNYILQNFSIQKQWKKNQFTITPVRYSQKLNIEFAYLYRFIIVKTRSAKNIMLFLAKTSNFLKASLAKAR